MRRHTEQNHFVLHVHFSDFIVRLWYTRLKLHASYRFSNHNNTCTVIAREKKVTIHLHVMLDPAIWLHDVARETS